MIKSFQSNINTKCKSISVFIIRDWFAFFVLYQTFKEEFSMKKQEVKIVKAAVQRSAKLDQGMKVELGLTDKKEQ